MTPELEAVYDVVWSGATWREAPPPPAPPPLVERAVPERRGQSVKLARGGTSEQVLAALAVPGSAHDIRRRTGLPAPIIHKTLWRLCLVGLAQPVGGVRLKAGTRYQRPA
jgi:hypothetical protein